MYTILYRNAPGQGDRADRPPLGMVHAAQPLWLVMMINVGKCHPVWCATAHGLPLSTAQQVGGRLHTKMGNMRKMARACCWRTHDMVHSTGAASFSRRLLLGGRAAGPRLLLQAPFGGGGEGGMRGRVARCRGRGHRKGQTKPDMTIEGSRLCLCCLGLECPLSCRCFKMARQEDERWVR